MHGSTNTQTQNTHTCEKERPASLPARANTRKIGIHTFIRSFIHSFIRSFVSLSDCDVHFHCHWSVIGTLRFLSPASL